jgi:lysophospholipase L1-like esterase
MHRRQFILILALAAVLPLSGAEPNKFQKDWDAYLEQDKTSPPPSEAILCTGSSSMRMWSSLKTDLAPLPVFNRAFGGSTTKDTVAAVPLIITPYRPKVILYYCGDNDLSKPTIAPEVAVDGFKAFVAAVRKDLPQVRFVYLAIKPSIKRLDCLPNQRLANAAIAELCAKDPLLTFVDVASVLLGPDGQPDPACYLKDNLHMTPEGYKRWTAVVKPALEKVWGEANGKK